MTSITIEIENMGNLKAFINPENQEVTIQLLDEKIQTRVVGVSIPAGTSLEQLKAVKTFLQDSVTLVSTVLMLHGVK